MKHLLIINQDSEATYKEYDVAYYNDNNDKVFVKKCPSIEILTDSLYHDTSIIPLKAKKDGNIDGDIQWSFELLGTADSDTASINEGFLRFSKHYEGGVKLTATAGGVIAEKTITIDCIETPLSVTYEVVQPSPRTVNWNTTEAVITYTGRIIETFALKPQRVTNIEGLTQTVAIGTNPHVQPSYATVDEYVDLGVGLKWAKCSIGAMNEYEDGLFFQWGDVDGYVGGTEPTKVYTGSFKWNGVDVNWTVNQNGFQKVFDWANYKYCNGNGSSLTKYNNKTSYGTVDDKTVLDPIDDAAVQRLGNGKRMPTTKEYQTLKENTYWQWVKSGTDVVVKVINDDGTIEAKTVKYPRGYFVYKVKDNAHKNKMNTAAISALYDYNYHPADEASSEKEADTHIFFPVSGSAGGTEVSGRGLYGYYWSSSLYTPNSTNGFYLFLDSGTIKYQYDNYRCYGYCVRSVSEN